MTVRLLIVACAVLSFACREGELADASASAVVPSPAATGSTADVAPAVTSFLEMRINDWGTSRYIRVERSGHVEFARHDFSKIKVFRAGTPSVPQAARIFDAFYERGIDTFQPEPPEEDGAAPAIDPSDVRLEIHDGDLHRVIVYRVSQLPEAVRAFHDFVLDTSFTFPENPLHGDYLRQYVVLDRATLPEDAVIRKLDAEELATMPAVRECMRFPGRLFHAGAAGSAPLRRHADLDPSGCFVERDGLLYRFSVYTWGG